ncbi:MAG: GNAT family N-acetyltransferase [Pseudomonadota bacterium]
MSTHNLDALLAPKAIALVGAKPDDPFSRALVTNLASAGFLGPIMSVGPGSASFGGVTSCRSIEDLPHVPDLGVILGPLEQAPSTLKALASRGARAAVLASSATDRAGFGALSQALLDTAKPTRMRVLGPGCKGLMVPGMGLCVGLAERLPIGGSLALITQSAGVLNSVLDWAVSRKIGFSHLIAAGEAADVDAADLLDSLSTDRHVRSIVLHLETIDNARKFMSAARAAARARIVVVIKGGRADEAQREPLARDAPRGSDAVYRAAFRRAGMLEIGTLDEVFDTVESLASGLAVHGDRLAIVSDSGGLGMLAVDRLLAVGGRLADLASETVGKLDRVLPTGWSRRNPVDLVGESPGERYGQALDAVLADPDNDAVLAINCPNALMDGVVAAEATISAARAHKRPLLTSWVGETSAADARRLFAEHRIATYATPSDAVRAFVNLARYQHNQAMLREVPPSISEAFAPRIDAAQSILDNALEAGRSALDASEVEGLLAAYDLRFDDSPAEIVMEMAEDSVFGPVISVARFTDRSLGFPPLNLALAEELIGEDDRELQLSLVKVSQLVCDLDRVVGLRISAGLTGIVAGGAQIRISGRRPGAVRMAIRPYPKELESALALRDGTKLLLRPIRPEDAPALRHMIEDKTEPEDRRLRFFSAISTLSAALCARMTQIDYDREMALVAIDTGVERNEAFCGVVRIAVQSDLERAEYAILVRSDLKGKGLGRCLMQSIIDYARRQGIREVFGEVLRENLPMLRLAERLGFRREAAPEEPEVAIVRLSL